MNKLISILIAAVAFWVMVSYLIPMLPNPIRTIALVVVVLCAIVFLISLFVDYSFPWKK